MAVNHRSRRVMLSVTTAGDDAANRRISALVFALPIALERELGGHFYLGAGADGERRLAEALGEIQRKEGPSQ